MAGLASPLKWIRPKKALVVAVVAAVGLGAAVVGYMETRDGDEALLEDGQQLVEVRLGDLVNQVTSSGSIVFPNREELSFGVAGTVSALLVAEGDQVYRAKCAVCHGRNGEGVAGLSGALVMPYDPEAPWPPFPRTVGNYWPYATTLFDYVRRAMPANAPGSLGANEVYAVVAWMLHRNEIVAADAVMDAQSLPAVEMPARRRFVQSDEAP